MRACCCMSLAFGTKHLPCIALTCVHMCKYCAFVNTYACVQSHHFQKFRSCCLLTPLTTSKDRKFKYFDSWYFWGLHKVVVRIAGLLPVAQPDLSQIAGGDVSSSGSLWDNGEWWMLLAAQSMALGTIMVRWVSK